MSASLRKGAGLSNCCMYVRTLLGSQPPTATILRRGCFWVEVFFSSTQFSPRLLWSEATIIKIMKSVSTSDFNFKGDFQHFLQKILSVFEDVSDPPTLFWGREEDT